MDSKHTLTEHQHVMLEMLHVIDAICNAHHISYQLFAGSLLGAVRHHGFIPWDDDIDIIMLRSEYEKFLTVAETALDKRTYFLQKEFSLHWPMFFTKLRKNGTACMEKFIPRDEKMHQGIYIDIFPCDDLSDKRWMRVLQFAASKVVIAKCLYARGYLTNSTAKQVWLQICRWVPMQPFYQLCLNKNKQKHATERLHSFFGAASRYAPNVYPRIWFMQTVYMQFEDSLFPVSAHYELLLTTLYGEWRAFPKMDARIAKCHGAIVDTQHSYEDYLNAQKELKIETYARSIR